MPFFFAELSEAATGDIAREASLSNYALIYLVGDQQTQNLRRVDDSVDNINMGSLYGGFV
jgi:hypothetical protein